MPVPLCPESQAISRPSSVSRSWAYNQLYSLFHGESVVKSVRKGTRNRKISNSSGSSSEYFYQPQNEHLAPGLRSPTSTRSLIDPSASPISSSRSTFPATFGRVRGTSQRSITARYGLHRESTGTVRAERHLSRVLSRPQHPRPLILTRPARKRSVCIPRIDDPILRKRAFGTIISGGILAILLSLYLALAISDAFQGRAWNVVLIIFILIATILFFHYLIRLFSLLLQARRRKQKHRTSSLLDRNGFAQPEEPIRVILVRDEELGLHESNFEEMNPARVASPPPAYGLWRCSVRADPNLLHWRRAEGLQYRNETNKLNLAGNTGNRPPSYVSEEEMWDNATSNPHITMPLRAHF